MSTEKFYFIRTYRAGDETDIAELFNIVFGQTLTETQWRWKYTGTGLTVPLIQLAFAPNGQLVGHAGAIRLRGWRKGQPLSFFQVCDVMVHPSARGQLGKRNLFTRLIRALLSGLSESNPESFAYGFPGQRPFFLGQHARVYGAIERAVSLYRPARKSLLPLLWTRSLKWDDARLDVLWATLAPNFSLALVRDRAYLHWRYATHPVHHYELFGLSLANYLFGWAVIQRDGSRLRVVDILTSLYWIKPALRILDWLASSMDMAEVDIWLPPDWRKAVNGRLEPTEVMVAQMIWQLPMPTEAVREELYYTMGDLDIF